MTLSGAAAVAYMYPGRPNTANACLYTVWLAYGAPHTLGPKAGYTFPNAIEAYNYTTNRHADRNPPAGVPVWFGACAGPRYKGDAHWRDGDIVVSIGGGLVTGTDQPVFGHIDHCTIAERERLTGRAYLGWSEDFIGNPVSFSAPSVPSATLIPKEDAMSFSLVKDAKSATIWVVSLDTGNYAGVQSPYHVTLLSRVKSNMANDPMLQVELDIVRAYLAAIFPEQKPVQLPPPLSDEQLDGIAAKVAASLPAHTPSDLNITLTGKASA